MQERVYLSGYVNCYVTAEGKIFNNGKEKTPIRKKGAAPQVRLQENNRTLTYGLATLVATHFLPNPNGYRKITFLDGNHRNCHASISAGSAVKSSPMLPSSEASRPTKQQTAGRQRKKRSKTGKRQKQTGSSKRRKGQNKNR